MKTSSAFFMFFWASQMSIAQPVSIDNESVPVEYYRMPDYPLDPSYSTYSADIQARFGGLSMTGFTTTSLEDEYLNLEGYKKVNREGDIEIEASIGDFNVFGERTDIRRAKKKEQGRKGNYQHHLCQRSKVFNTHLHQSGG